jgi:hypothetical protein
LFSDPVLYAGLRAGNYYLAVSNSFNVPDAVNSPPGTNGVFDPNVSHSGQNGGSTGDYVLNLQARAIPNPPQVIGVNPKDGAILDAPPTYLTVQFSEPVNLQQLASLIPLDPTTITLAAVYIQGSDGSKYHPTFVSYDASTNQVTFLMLDGLANGVYELHLSGSLGLADNAGNALAGNDPSGDYVVHFEVNAPARGTGSNPLLWSDQEPNDGFDHPQDIGALFLHDIHSEDRNVKKGVTLQRDFTQTPENAPTDTGDYYRFQVLYTGGYTFNFLEAGLPAGVQATLLDAAGNPVSGVAPQPNSLGFIAFLHPGVYELHIGDWTPIQAADAKYSVVIELPSYFDNPVPLTVGPAPAISIQPVTDAPTSPPPRRVVVSSPPVPSPPVAHAPLAPPASTPTSAASDAPAGTASDSPTSTNSPPANGSPLQAATADSPTGTVASAIAPASPSVAVLVNLLVPTGVNNTSITQSTVRSTAESITLPAGVLLALGAAPVGAVKDPNLTDAPPPADHVMVRMPDQTAPRPMQPPTALTSRTETGTSTVWPPASFSLPGAQSTDPGSVNFIQPPQELSPSATDPEAGEWTALLSQGIHQFVNVASAGTLDVLFSRAQWMEESDLEPSNSLSLPQAISAEEPTETFEGRAHALPGRTAQAPAKVGDQILVIGLAALAAVTMARMDKPQRFEINSQRLEIRAKKSESSLFGGAR